MRNSIQDEFLTVLKAAVCVLVIDACGSSLGSSYDLTRREHESDSDGVPALTLSLTDAPIERAAHVYVAVTGVQISQTGEEWINIPLKINGEIDLLHPQDGFSSLVAAIDNLPAGLYTQTRLILAEDAPGRLIDEDNKEHKLELPNGSERDLMVPLAFTKVAGVPLNLTLDFNLRQSLKKIDGQRSHVDHGYVGKYIFQPVVRLVDNSRAGYAVGEGQNGSVVCIYEDGKVKDTDDSCGQAITSTLVRNGQFKLSFLEPGSYEVRIFRNGHRVGDVGDVLVQSDDEEKAASRPRIRLP